MVVTGLITLPMWRYTLSGSGTVDDHVRIVAGRLEHSGLSVSLHAGLTSAPSNSGLHTIFANFRGEKTRHSVS